MVSLKSFKEKMVSRSRSSFSIKPDLLESNAKELFIIFFIFSLVGHYLEVFWAGIKYLAFGSTWLPTVVDIIPLAVPYGLGAVAIILIVLPIAHSKKLKITSVFVFSALVSGLVEFLCAAFLVLLYGRNAFWDYSSKPFNVFGFTWIGACLLFGIAAISFIYLIYPKFKKIMTKLSKKQISFIFWLLFVAYLINLSIVIIREFLI